MFVPLSTFFMKKRREELSSSQVNFIKHWFWRSSFNNRYGSESAAVGVTDSKILINGTDLRNVNGLNRPLFSPADLVEAASGSAIGKAFLGLLQSYKPLDLYSNIDLRIKGVQKRKKRIKSIDKHHIFPKDYLKTKLRGNNRQLINSVCNIVWVSQNTNLLIKNTPPSKYFKKLKEVNKNFKESAEQQFIPTAISSPIWTNNYKKFIKQRAELVFREAKTKCGF